MKIPISSAIRIVRASVVIFAVVFVSLIGTQKTEAHPAMSLTYHVAYTIDHYYGSNLLDYEWGAYFTGASGQQQKYWGVGGDSATCLSGSGCISSWGWVGPVFNYLQLPKRWLYVVGGASAWIAGNYSAYLY